MANIQKVCARCGSSDVLADAYAEWDIEAQRWELQNVFDKGAYCNRCDGETRIEDKELRRKRRASTIGHATHT